MTVPGPAGEIEMRIIFIGLLVLTCGIFIGCDKEIKEAVRPAAAAPVHA